METVWLGALLGTAAAAGVALYRLIQRAVASMRRGQEQDDAAWRKAARASAWILASALLISATAAALLMFAFLYVVTSHPRPFGMFLLWQGPPIPTRPSTRSGTRGERQGETLGQHDVERRNGPLPGTDELATDPVVAVVHRPELEAERLRRALHIRRQRQLENGRAMNAAPARGLLCCTGTRQHAARVRRQETPLVAAQLVGALRRNPPQPKYVGRRVHVEGQIADR